MEIKNIFIHHSGGLGKDNLASTLHLTPADINEAHKERWNFQSSMGSFVGYNFIYDPKTGFFTQHRKIGEETAAQKGNNFDSISICVIGNYNTLDGYIPVDTLTDKTTEDVTSFIFDLLQGNKRGCQVAPGTILKLSLSRIYPHRAVADTDCYGWSIPDNFFRNKVTDKYMGVLSGLVKLLQSLLTSLPKKTLGGANDRECSGRI